VNPLPEIHGLSSPSPWIVRFAPLVKAGARVLDVASGAGRHARLFADRGCKVDAVDRDQQALAGLTGVANIQTIAADIEGSAWPFASGSYDAIVVTNYLHRPLFEKLIASLNESGVLLYETFMLGNEQYGRPSRPEFLLRPGELLELVTGKLEVVAFEQGLVEHPKPAVVQRLAAVKPGYEPARRL
jgi:SAM-dependent methyltransferase